MHVKPLLVRKEAQGCCSEGCFSSNISGFSGSQRDRWSLTQVRDKPCISCFSGCCGFFYFHMYQIYSHWVLQPWKLCVSSRKTSVSYLSFSTQERLGCFGIFLAYGSVFWKDLIQNSPFIPLPGRWPLGENQRSRVGARGGNSFLYQLGIF